MHGAQLYPYRVFAVVQLYISLNNVSFFFVQSAFRGSATRQRVSNRCADEGEIV